MWNTIALLNPRNSTDHGVKVQKRYFVGRKKVGKMKKYRCPSVFLIALIISGCSSWQQNYGKLRMLSKGQNEVTIQDLIDKWEDYNIYYSDKYDGFDARSPLGIMFDPKNNDTALVGDRWKKVEDQKTLIEMIRWIYPTTQYEPWLNEILGPDGRFYGYLYYSYGFAIFKVVDDNTLYVFNLDEPGEEGNGDAFH
jgi:hypothetical protein